MGKTRRNLPFGIRREINEANKYYTEQNTINKSIPSDHFMSYSICKKLPRSSQRTIDIPYGGGRPSYVYKFNDKSIKIPPKKQYDAPCPCCFGTEGRMWMLTGLGNKSINKTKGMHKHNNKLTIFNSID